MRFTPATLSGVWTIDLDPHEDERGFFARTYCDQEFEAHGLNTRWPQCNLTLTKRKGTIRGMHFQADPRPEIKLIRCAHGAIHDVLVDVRRESETFGHWEAFRLDADGNRMLYVPGGFAHGFQTLAPNTRVFYQMSDYYVPDLARGIRWDDPEVGIEWPDDDVFLSERDRQLPLLAKLS